MMPIRKPMTVPRHVGMVASRHSWRDGSRSRRRGRMTSGGVGCPAVRRISARPNRPTATGTTPIPSPSSAIPYAKRKYPLMWSMPIMPSSSPSAAMASPRSIEPAFM
jgi:hypothetical protein